MPSTPDEEYEIVYQAICAVAANCDGAREQDGVGFNGQDTMFGRRIAAIPFAQWTQDIKDEAASIVVTYRKQALAYTGIDVATLSVVSEQRRATNHAGRGDARRLTKAQGKRFATFVANDRRLGACIACKFPYDAALKDTLKALGARWNDEDKTWRFPVAKVTAAVQTVLVDNGFDVDPAAEAVLSQAPEAAAAVEAPPAKRTCKLIGETTVRTESDYDARLIDAFRAIPGRRYVGGEVNDIPLNAANLAWLEAEGFVGVEAIRAHITGLDDKEAEAAAKAQLLAKVSRMADPADIPEEFLALATARRVR